MSTDLQQLRAKDVMSKHVVAITPNDSLHDALHLMVENRVAALPVIDRKDHCIGVLSSSDLIEMTCELDDDLTSLGKGDIISQHWLLEKLQGGIGNDKVNEHMTRNVASVDSEAPLAQVAAEMLRNQVHRVPVVDKNERLLGIVSTMDILQAFANGA